MTRAPKPTSSGQTMKANPDILRLWATRTKCFMCKHRFDKPVILPTDKPERDKYQPNFNPEYLFHAADTHGLPPDILKERITGSIYGMELGLTGIKGIEHHG